MCCRAPSFVVLATPEPHAPSHPLEYYLSSSRREMIQVDLQMHPNFKAAFCLEQLEMLGF